MKLKKIIVGIILILTVFGLTTNLYANELEGLSYEELKARGYSERYIEWLNLSEDEKQKTIEPFCFNIEYKEPKEETGIFNRFFKSLKSTIGATTLSAKFDLRDRINVDVGSQGQAGDCWAFTATSMLETTLANKYGDRNSDFSERHLNYYTADDSIIGQNNKYGIGRTLKEADGSPMGGGIYDLSAYYINGGGPIEKEEFLYVYREEYPNFPFAENYEKIPEYKFPINSAVKKVDDIIYLPGMEKNKNSRGEIIYKDSNGRILNNSEVLGIRNQIKNHIKNYGGVHSSIFFGNETVSESEFLNEENAAYNVTVQHGRNHAVTIIGWDDNFSIDNFKVGCKPSTPGAYIVLNSHGSDFGKNGIFYVSYEDCWIESNLCGFESVSDINYDKIYQYDNYINILNYLGGSKAYCANVFKCTGEEKLVEVVIGVHEAGKYNVYVNTTGNLKNNRIQIATNKELHTGYNTIKINREINLSNGNDFAIIVENTQSSFTLYAGAVDSEFEGQQKSYESKNGIDWEIVDEYSYIIKAYTQKNDTSKIEATDVLGEAHAGEKGEFSFSVKSSSTKRNEPVNLTFIGPDGNTLPSGKITVKGNKIKGNGAFIQFTTPIDLLQGNYTVKAKVNGTNQVSKTFTIQQSNIRGIALTSPILKKNYIKGENLDLTGGKFVLVYNNGTESPEIDMTLEMANKRILDETGAVKIIITYMGKTLEFNVLVTNNATGISIDTPPTKIEYIKGENLDLRGGKLKVTFEDGTSKIIDMTDSKVTYEGYDPNKIDVVQNVKIKYENLETYLQITVINNIKEIKIDPLPTKVTYIKGESLNLEGGKLKVIYQVGEEIIPLTAEMIKSEFDSNLLGIHTIEVEYEGFTTSFKVTVTNNIKSISVAELPIQTKYALNEALDLKGGKILITYENGTEQIKMSEIGVEVSGDDFSTEGKKTITLTYKEKQTSFEVEVSDRVTSMIITSYPTRKYYLKGEELDLTGGEIEVRYQSRKTYKKLMTDPSINIGTYDNTTTGRKSITVGYLGMSNPEALFTIEVIEKIEGIVANIFSLKKTTYVKGEPLDLTDAKIRVIYRSDFAEEVAITPDMIENYDTITQTTGNKTLKINYLGKTIEDINISVVNNISEISVESRPTKVSYLYNKEDLDLTGGSIKVKYANGEIKTVGMKDTGVTVTGFNKTKLGEQTVTIKYEGLATTFKVVVVNDLFGISVVTPPTKTVYIKDKEDLDLTGGQIRILYQNAENVIKGMKEAGVTTTGFDKTKLGKQDIFVNYEGKEAIFNVEVINTEEGIRVKKNPTKTTYVKGEELNLAGGEIEVTYANGETKTVGMTEEGVTVVGYNNTKLGEQELTVRYEEKTATFKVTVVNEVAKIEIENLPSQIIYIKGESLNVFRGRIKITYVNGETGIVEIKPEMVTGFDNTKIGKQTLTVTYKEKQTTFEIEVIDEKAVITGIIIEKMPNKLNYLIGEELDLTGSKIKVMYESGETLLVDIEPEMITEFDNTKAGIQTLIVVYGLHQTSFEVEVVEQSIEMDVIKEIVIESMPNKTVYKKGEELDLTGAKLRVIYEDFEELEDKIFDIRPEMVKGYDKNLVGKQTLTVEFTSYILFTTTFEVEVVEELEEPEIPDDVDEIKEIKIESMPTKTTYIKGENLNLIGGKIKVIYESGKTEIKDITLSMVTGYNKEELGKQILTVSYEGKTVTFEVEVVEEKETPEKPEEPEIPDVVDEIKEIIIKSMPTKTIYTKGEELDLTEATLKIVYESGKIEIKDITLSMVTGYNKEIVGEQTVTVTYEGFQVKFNVEVIEIFEEPEEPEEPEDKNDIEKIVIKTLPIKTKYVKNENLNLTGGKILVIYENGNTEEIEMTSSDVNISGYHKSRVGIQEITVEYKGFKVRFNVEVKRYLNIIPLDIILNKISDITISSLPQKVDYIKGEELNLAGGKIKVSYKDGTVKEIEMTSKDIIVKGYNKEQVGKQTITLSYKGKIIKFEVTVTNNISEISVKSKPQKTIYIKGEQLDLTDGKILITYEDKTTREIDMTQADVTVEGYDKEQLGEQTITLSYKGKQTTFIIMVKETKDIIGIEIKTNPQKLSYTKEEDLDLTGGKILIIFEDKTTKEINMTEEDVIVTGYDKTKLGEQEVTISYKEKTETFKVRVTNDLLKIVVKTNPEKLTYIKGEELDLTGGKIEIIYEDGTTEEKDILSEEITVTGYDKTKTGKQIVMISYREKSTTFNVKVISYDIIFNKYVCVMATNENEENYIEEIYENDTIKDLKDDITTEGTIKIFNKENEEITDDSTKIATGMTVEITVYDKVIKYKTVVTGDINGDGKVDIIDQSILAGYIVEKDSAKEIMVGAYLRAANVFRDDNIGNILDIAKLARVLVGLEKMEMIK